MGNIVSHFRSSVSNKGLFEYRMYEKSPRRHRHLTFGIVAALSALVGYRISGSVFISICASSLPVIPLWIFRKRLWPDLQPEFMTDDWRNCVATIDKIITKLDLTHASDKYVFQYPIVLNLPLLHLYHQHHCQPFNLLSDIHEVPKEELRLALHFMKHASAAYGTVVLQFLGLIKDLPNPFNTSLSIDHRAISMHTGVSLDDIVGMELSGQHVVCPRYYIAIDHGHKTVVLAVRGTLSLGDVITDLMCESTEFLTGTAHKGIKDGAQLLFEKTFSTICYLLTEQRGYTLTITGHSLGAGTSILLTLMFLLAQRKTKRSKTLSLPQHLKVLAEEHELPSSTVIKCYAFAPPPVFSPLEILPQIFTDSIQVYANNSDIVPRLSLATFNELLHYIKKIDKCKLGTQERFKAAIFRKDHPSVIDLIKTVKEELTEFELLWQHDAHEFTRLHIPGHINYFHKSMDSSIEGKDMYNAIKVSPLFFSKMLLMEGFFSDHLPDKYEQALQSLCS